MRDISIRGGKRSVASEARDRRLVEVVVRHGYHPATIAARAGSPLRLVFRRDDDDPCTERIVFSEPGLVRRLAAGGTTIVDLPARSAGQVRFTCGMGRYTGRIDFLAQPPTSLAGRVKERTEHLETALGTALILWICSLPVIAVLAVLVLDAGSTLVAAAAALVAWVIGCLWAFGTRSASSQPAHGRSR